MKAIRQHAHGGPESLRYEDAPRPSPRAGEVLVRVLAAGVIPTELLWQTSRTTRSGTPRPLPLIPGHEFSGEVKPRVESRIGFRVAGKVLRRQAEVGQRVQAGQLLAQLDPQDYRLAADAAKAQVAAAATHRDEERIGSGKVSLALRGRYVTPRSASGISATMISALKITAASTADCGLLSRMKLS